MAATPPLSARALGRATLARQGLLAPICDGTATVVQRLGSLQAQHPEWPPIALATRSADRATADLAGALDRREVARSSLMRITIHVVAADDMWPMFLVCQPMRLDQWRLIARADPVSSALGRRLTAAHAAAIEAMAERPRSSLELDRIMSAAAAPVPSSVPRLAWRHLAANVPLVHVPHEGEGYGRSRYALASEWLGSVRPTVGMNAARQGVARRYLAAFGPASAEDLAAYVGRGRGGITPWRGAIAELGDEVVALQDDAGRTLFDLADAERPPADTPAPPRLLARWDSVLLSHAPKWRGRILDERARAAVFTRNADVLPTFLVDGAVAGTWDLDRSADDARVTLRPLASLSALIADALLEEAARVLHLVTPDGMERSVEIARPT